jgi:hypothetical protein
MGAKEWSRGVVGGKELFFFFKAFLLGELVDELCGKGKREKEHGKGERGVLD